MLDRPRRGKKSRGLGSALYFVRASTSSLNAGVQCSPEQMNGPFPSCFVALFLNEFSCKNFLLKMNLICIKMNLQMRCIFITIVSHEESI